MKHNTIKTYAGAEVQLHAFLTSALDGNEWSASRLGRFKSGERTPYPSDRRLSGPHSQSGSDGEEKKFPSLLCQESNPGRPARRLITVLSRITSLSD